MEQNPFVDRLEGLLDRAQSMRDEAQGHQHVLWGDISESLKVVAQANKEISQSFSILLNMLCDMRDAVNAIAEKR